MNRDEKGKIIRQNSVDSLSEKTVLNAIFEFHKIDKKMLSLPLSIKFFLNNQFPYIVSIADDASLLTCRI